MDSFNTHYPKSIIEKCFHGIGYLRSYTIFHQLEGRVKLTSWYNNDGTSNGTEQAIPLSSIPYNIIQKLLEIKPDSLDTYKAKCKFLTDEIGAHYEFTWVASQYEGTTEFYTIMIDLNGNDY